MHRIDHATLSGDENGSGKDGFTEGTPGTVAATVVTDDWLNDIQEEIANTVEGGGETLVKGTQTQLLTAVSRISGGVKVPRILVGSDFTPDDDGSSNRSWVLSPASAYWTSRANNAILFVHLPLPTDLSSHNVNVDAFLDPGSARSGADRMLLSLYSLVISTHSASLLSSAYDDGTAAAQTVSIDQSVTSSTDYSYFVMVTAGNDASTATDRLYNVSISIDDYPA